MNIKEFLVNCLLQEQSIVEELLYIDNKIQHTQLTYDNLIKKISLVSPLESLNNINEEVVISDGEIETVFKVLISEISIDTIYLNNCFLGINSYLINRAVAFYGINSICVDKSDNYQKYQDISKKIIIIGFDTFVEEVSKDLPQATTIVV